MQDMIRVAVVDDQNISRSFFEMYVRSSKRYELIAALPSAEMAVDLVERQPVDLIIMDVLMRWGLDGLSAAEKIKKAHPEIKIILTTSTSETSWEEMAREIGVESFWYKEYDEQSLLEIMDRTTEGEHIYPESPPDQEFGRIRRSDLTERELEVLRELTNCLSNEEIAGKLFISVNTVRFHIQNMLSKTGFENRLELAMNAKALGLVVSDEDRTKNAKR